MTKLGVWFAGLGAFRRGLLSLAALVVLLELVLRTCARGSALYARWTRGVEVVGSVWTALLLSVIYVLSVGPISLANRLAGKDPLDRALRPEPTFWRPHEPNPLGPRSAARHQF